MVAASGKEDGQSGGCLNHKRNIERYVNPIGLFSNVQCGVIQKRQHEVTLMDKQLHCLQADLPYKNVKVMSQSWSYDTSVIRDTLKRLEVTSDLPSFGLNDMLLLFNYGRLSAPGSLPAWTTGSDEVTLITDISFLRHSQRCLEWLQYLLRPEAVKCRSHTHMVHASKVAKAKGSWESMSSLIDREKYTLLGEIWGDYVIESRAL